MKLVHVAVAVLFDQQSRIVIARRPEHVHQGGLLEFPGGKVEAGEELPEALVREMKEELGVDVTASPMRPLIRIEHQYVDKHVYLDVWVVQGYVGELHGREGQEVYLYDIDDLKPEDFPAANKAIIDALKLPARCLITGPFHGPEEVQRKLRYAADRGVTMAVLRAPELSQQDYRHWAESIINQWHREFPILLVHGASGLALINNTSLPVDGCHLNSAQLKSLERRPLPPEYWLGASCHNLHELDKAAQLGCRYGFISPVNATQSHTGVQGIGWEAFAELTRRASFPVFGLGGLKDEDIQQAQWSGGQGVAAISAWWQC